MRHNDTFEQEDKDRSEVRFKPLNLPSVSIPEDELKPFTFNHFVVAMNRVTDDFLMPYIDYAVSIYCKMRNTNVGDRPNKRSEYSGAYADAFEIALNAIYIAATKMDGFDPHKGEFRTYWGITVHDALADLIKKDKYGDFFDQTSKKTKSDSDPEVHCRVDSDSYWVGNDSPEMNDEEVRRTERFRAHVSDAFECMRKFIDALPERDREAVYLSEIGHVLRPEHEYLGRNYAETLAKRFNTTAGNIRKIASTKLTEAVAFTNYRGYNAASMGSVMDFKYHITPHADSFDPKGIIEALTQLTPYEQFKLLYYLANAE